jgi:WD40 repeat protein
VFALALLPDKTRMLSGSVDGSVFSWNTAAKPDERKRLTFPTPVGPWRFSPDSRSIVTFDWEGRVARWQGTDFYEMQPLFELGTNFHEACFSGDGRWLATSYRGGQVQIRDLQNRNLSCEFTSPAQSVIPRQFMAEGKKLMITHERDNSLHEWDLETRQETRSWPPAPGRYTGAFSPDGNWYLTSILKPDTKSVTSLTELSSGREKNLNLGWYVGATFSPDGRLFALASWSREVRLWETATPKEVVRLGDFRRAVWAAAFSPGVKRLATTCELGNETVKLWDVESHEGLLNLEGHGSYFDSVAFSPDGNILAASNWRGVFHLWRAPSWAEIEAKEKESRTDDRK